MDYTLAKLHQPKTGNDWYIYWRSRVPETGVMKMFKDRGDLNRIKDLRERKREGKLLELAYNNKLRAGWSPMIMLPQQIENTSTVLEILDQYLKTKQTSVRKRSYDHYKWAIKLFKEYLVKNHLEIIKCVKFTKTMAFGYSDYLLSEKKYSGKSHNNQISNMRVFFEMMTDRDVIDKNPFKPVKNKPEEKGRVISYSDGQKKIIKEYLIKNDHPLFLFVQLIYYCFIRPNEIMQLQVKHIDFEFKRVQIPAYASKNRKQSSVDVPALLWKSLKMKYEKSDSEYFLFGLNLQPGIKSVHRNRASKSHQTMLQDLKIKDLVLYDWKHAGARDYILSGGNPYELMVKMRHHSLEQTMTYLRSVGVSMNDKSKNKKHFF